MKKYSILLIVLVTLTTSCQKWLTVEPRNQIIADQLFQSEEGFSSALVGLYVTMRNNYNPGGFFVSGGTEILANVYYNAPLSSTRFLHEHDYTNTDADNMLGAAFLNQYKTISNTISLLEGIEKHGEEVLSPTKYQLFKGEALALRAFLHFDVIRLWGPMPDKADSKTYLPYVKQLQTTVYDYETYTSFMRLLMDDLDEAEKLLKEVDPLLAYSNANLNTTALVLGDYKGQDWFWRQNRLNYFAVLALKARVYDWLGENDKAVEYAKKVVESGKFTLGTVAQYGTTINGFSLFSEHIMGLHIQLFDEQLMFNGRYASCFNLPTDIDALYPIAVDMRKANWNSNFSYTVGQNVSSTRKYNGMRLSTNVSPFSVPVLRLSEMYFILMDRLPIDQANPYYSTFQTSRSIPVASQYVLTEANKETLLMDEFYREFYAEGQIFFRHKRLNSRFMRWGEHTMSEQQYVLPLPTGEQGIYNQD